MPSKSKAKGNRFERECVKIAKEYGLESRRIYRSM
jgi:Holliday junction resolvase